MNIIALSTATQNGGKKLNHIKCFMLRNVKNDLDRLMITLESRNEWGFTGHQNALKNLMVGRL